jgi:outer membrane protein OmpA-like peptidoglycan-associated protein
MKSLIKKILVITMVCVSFNSYGQFKLDLKKSVDAVQNGIKGAKNKTDQNKQVQKEGKTSSTDTTKTGNNKDNQNSDQKQPGFQSYSKYDFIPGEKIVFFDDFSQDNIGDFPALWNTNGSAEVVTTNLYPGRWMKFDGRESIWTDQLLTLPENYTIEFDIVPTKGSDGRIRGYHFRLMQANIVKAFDGGGLPGKAGFDFCCDYGNPTYNTYINSDEGHDMGLSGSKGDIQYYEKLDQKYHIALWVQKGRVRLYQEQNKLFDLPRAFAISSVKMDRIRFEEGAAMVTNIRIAVGSPDMRNKLITEGKLVSYGIYFDVNKDAVKPESYGTLKEIASILNENPDVKVKIVGYTDSDGTAAANLDLSKRRGASVKNELVKTFGIDASRLESDGLGETQPIAPNDTPENKALNRRVEFIKL